MPIRLLLSSKHKVVSEGIAAVLRTHPDIHLVGMADSHDSTQHLCDCAEPDVVLIGMQSHDARNLALMQQIASQQPACQMVVFSADADRNSVMEILDAGAKAYVCTTSTIDELLAASGLQRRGECICVRPLPTR